MRVVLLPRNGKITSIIMQNEKVRRKKNSFHVFKKSVCKNGLSRVKRQMTLGKYL